MILRAGKAITTRRTRNVQAPSLLSSLVPKNSVTAYQKGSSAETVQSSPSPNTAMMPASNPEPEPAAEYTDDHGDAEAEIPEPREDFGA